MSQEPANTPVPAALTARLWAMAGVRLLTVLAIGLVVGLVLGRPFLGLFLVLLLHSGWQLASLLRLDHWLRHRSLMIPPQLGGVWDDIVTQVVRLHRRKRYHKQRMLQVLRELRDSTAALPDAVVVLDAHGQIVWFNRMATEMLDLRPRQDVGIPIENLLRQPEFGRYLRGEQYSQPLLLTKTVGGADAFLSVHVLPYGNGQRLLLVRDVTRQMRIEAMRKDFIANASHELRSPLTVISGYLETLSGDPTLDPGIAGPLDEMRRQSLRMRGIVDDLLELSRLEARGGQVEGTALDVGALLALLRKDVLARPSHPADVRLVMDSDNWLVGDEGEILSAFSNLVDNAAKYTPPEGSVELRWWTDERGGHFSVTDTGIGISAEHLPRVTERFYRADPGRSRATGGSGLGLAIVKHALQRHGGSLEAESVEGKGSTFTCHFPRRRVVPPLPREASRL